MPSLLAGELAAIGMLIAAAILTFGISRIWGLRRERRNQRILELEEEISAHGRELHRVQLGHDFEIARLRLEITNLQDDVSDRDLVIATLRLRNEQVEDTMRAAAGQMRKVPPAFLAPIDYGDTPDHDHIPMHLSPVPAPSWGEEGNTGAWAREWFNETTPQDGDGGEAA